MMKNLFGGFLCSPEVCFRHPPFPPLRLGGSAKDAVVEKKGGWGGFAVDVGHGKSLPTSLFQREETGKKIRTGMERMLLCLAVLAAVPLASAAAASLPSEVFGRLTLEQSPYVAEG